MWVNTLKILVACNNVMLTGYMQECSIIMQYALFVQHILCCKLIVIFTIIWPWHFFCLKLLHILAFSEIIAVPWGFPWILPWISLNFTLNQFWILAPSVFLWKTLQRFPQNYKYLLNSNYSVEFLHFLIEFFSISTRFESIKSSFISSF